MCSQFRNFLGIYEKSLPDTLKLREKIQLFKKAGYHCFELSIDESDKRINRVNWSKEQIEAFIGLMQEEEFYSYSICLSANRKYPIGDQDAGIRNRGVELIQKAVDFSLKVGIRVILIPGYDTYYRNGNGETKKLFLNSLDKVVQYAAGRGVILALENIEKPFMNSVDAAMEYIKEIPTPYLQCYVDPGNMVAAGIEDLIGQVQRAKGHIAAIHLKDGRWGEFKNVHYGSGKVDFVNLFQSLAGSPLPLCTTEVNALASEQESYENILYVRTFLEAQYQQAKKKGGASFCSIQDAAEWQQH